MCRMNYFKSFTRRYDTPCVRVCSYGVARAPCVSRSCATALALLPSQASQTLPSANVHKLTASDMFCGQSRPSGAFRAPRKSAGVFLLVLFFLDSHESRTRLRAGEGGRGSARVASSFCSSLCVRGSSSSAGLMLLEWMRSDPQKSCRAASCVIAWARTSPEERPSSTPAASGGPCTQTLLVFWKLPLCVYQVKQIERRDSVLTNKQQIERLLRPGSSYFNLNPFEVRAPPGCLLRAIIHVGCQSEWLDPMATLI